MRTWQDNADEFGAIQRGEGGWSLAALVACSVEKGKGSGAPSKLLKTGTTFAGAKVSAFEFSKRADCGIDSVLRYLNRWDELAAKGIVTPSADLSPSDVGLVELPSVPFNGRGGLVKTGGDHPTLKTQLGKASPDDIEMALDGLDAGKLSALAESAADALANKLASSELEDIANGGRIPTEKEVTERLKTKLPAGIDEIAKADKAWELAHREMTKAIETVTSYTSEHGIKPDTEQAKALKDWAVALIDLIDTGVTA